MGPGSSTILKDYMRSRKIRKFKYALIPAACFSYVYITEPAGLKASSSTVRAMISMLQNTMCLALSYRHAPDADEIFKIWKNPLNQNNLMVYRFYCIYRYRKMRFILFRKILCPITQIPSILPTKSSSTDVLRETKPLGHSS